MMTPVDVSIIIVAYNVEDLVDRCLTHLKESEDHLTKEIIFVNNGSTDGTSELVERKYPQVKVIETQKNLGFVGANNLAYQKAQGKYLLMLNSDAFVGSETLQKMTDYMEQHSDCGVVGCQAVKPDGTALPSARFFPTPFRLLLMKMGLEGRISLVKDTPLECDWVTGCALMVRKDIVDQQGFFLRSDFFMYNDDNDLCLRAKKEGWKVMCLPEEVVHLVGYTSDKIAKTTQDELLSERLQLESEYIYFRKNYSIFKVLLHFSLVVCFDLIQILKRIVLFKKEISPSKHLEHMKVAYQLLRQTGFGDRAHTLPVEQKIDNSQLW